jgi:small subunit ribosomal protein S3Ae
MAVDRSLKIKKKKWVEILAPKLFREEFIGESLVADPQSLQGRKVTISLMQLIRDPKKQSTNITFEITKVQSHKATTKLKSYKIGAAALKRLARRRRDKIQDSFLCKTKDDITIRIKPMIITFANTSKQVLSKIRLKAKEVLASNAKTLTFEELVQSLLSNTLQKDIRKHVKKLYPVRIVEISYIGIESPKRAKKSKIEEARELEEPKEEVKEELKEAVKEVATEKGEGTKANIEESKAENVKSDSPSEKAIKDSVEDSSEKPPVEAGIQSA